MTAPGRVPTPPQDIVDEVAQIKAVIRRMQQNTAGATTANGGSPLATPAQLPSITAASLSAGTGAAAARYDHAHTSQLSAQQDVTITTPANNQLLQYNSATSKWVNATVSGSSTLAGDTDVTISSPAANQALVYNGTKWANTAILSSSAPAAVGTSASAGTGTTVSRTDHVHTSTLANQGDVAVTSPADGQLLTYQASSSKWVNKVSSQAGMFSRYTGAGTTLGTGTAIPFATLSEGSGTGITVAGSNTQFTLSSGIWRVCLSCVVTSPGSATVMLLQLGNNATNGSTTQWYGQQSCTLQFGQLSCALHAEVRSTGSALVVAWAFVDAACALSTAAGLPRLTFNWSPL